MLFKRTLGPRPCLLWNQFLHFSHIGQSQSDVQAINQKNLMALSNTQRTPSGTEIPVLGFGVREQIPRVAAVLSLWLLLLLPIAL